MARLRYVGLRSPWFLSMQTLVCSRCICARLIRFFVAILMPTTNKPLHVDTVSRPNAKNMFAYMTHRLAVKHRKPTRALIHDCVSNGLIKLCASMPSERLGKYQIQLGQLIQQTLWQLMAVTNASTKCGGN